MKFLHLADLHVGKVVNGFSMLEDQRYVFHQILTLVTKEKPNAILIAGDVYDKAIPTAEAVSLLDDFLVSLTETKTPVLIISGNHDSPERLCFGGKLMAKSSVYIAPVFQKELMQVPLWDEEGEVRFILLPFIKPSHARRAFPEATIENYTQAVKTVLDHQQVDEGVRNVLLSHQFVTGGSRSDSEIISIGGSDNVDASAFDGFDYVALGHLHGAQKMSRDTIRYAGSPLKYSFSECRHHKSVTMVTMGKKGDVSIEAVPLLPLHDMRKIKGTYLELMKASPEDGANDDYVDVTLTDETDVIDGLQKLRLRYPNLMALSYDNLRTQGGHLLQKMDDLEQKTPLQLFEAFFEARNNQPMTDQQREYIKSKMECIWEGEA